MFFGFFFLNVIITLDDDTETLFPNEENRIDLILAEAENLIAELSRFETERKLLKISN